MRLLTPLLLAAATPALAAAERPPFDAPPLVDDGDAQAAPATQRPARLGARPRLPDTALAKVASGQALATRFGRALIVLPPQAIGPFDRAATAEQRVGFAEVRAEGAALPLSGLTFMPNGGLDITISQVGGASR